MASLLFPKWHQFELSTGAPAASYWLHFLTTGTSTAKDAYSDVDATTPIANPYQLNSAGRPAANIYISGKYRVVLHSTNSLLTGTSIADVDPVEDGVRASSFQAGSATYGGNNTGTVNALVFTFNPAVTAAVNGRVMRGRITGDNSGAVTISYGAGVKSLVKRDGAALVSGDLQGPDIIEWVEDTTTDVCRLLSPDGTAYLNNNQTFSGTNTFSGTITGAAITGYVVGTAIASSTTRDSTALQIPADNTIPQNTEGKEYLTVSYTPKFSTSKLRVRFSATRAGKAASITLTVAMFRDSTANAIQAHSSVGGADEAPFEMTAIVDASSTSATTFKIRYGNSDGATNVYMNGAGSGDFYGGIATSYLTVEEIKQ